MTPQKNKETITIYTIPHYMVFFDLGRLKVRLVALSLQEMVKQYMEHGQRSDICIMPFVSQYKTLLSAFRARNLTGPVIFLAEAAIDGSVMSDVHKLGALLIDIRHQKPEFFRLFVLFLIKNQQAVYDAAGEKVAFTESEQFAETFHRSYYKEPPLRIYTGEKEGKSNGENIRAILSEALDQPEVVLFETLYTDKSLYETHFTFNFTVALQKEKRHVSFSCMAKLHSIDLISSATRKRMLYFHQFHPDFSVTPLRRRAMKISRDEIKRALVSKAADSRYVDPVECIFSLAGLNRTAFLLPAAKKDDDTIGFIPMTDAFIQSRQFFRIEPSDKSPILVIVGSFFAPSRKVDLIDISEQGISFMSDYLFKKESELSIFLSFETTKIVCYGITRFSSANEIAGKHKIGVELYLHPDECAKLRKYVFNCQIDIMNAIREDYS